MASGYSLHIGVNYLDVDHYGSRGVLKSCERDAFAMEQIAQAQGFHPVRLRSVESTRERVISEVEAMAAMAVAGDLVWITYSGHGSQLPGTEGDEADGLDETWCLHDAQLLDDELYRLLCGFASGVRICLVTDSCHNQTIHKDRIMRLGLQPIKALSTKESNDAYDRNTDFYRQIRQRLRQQQRPALRASLIVLSACEDDDFAVPGDLSLSEFTAWIKFVYRAGAFEGNYREFIEAIRRQVRDRVPQLEVDGPGVEAFLEQQPFRI